MEASDAQADNAATTAEMARIHGLIGTHDFAAGLAAAESLLARRPRQRDALLFAAIAQRRLGRHAEALGTLARLQQHYPRYSRLYEERGRCYVELRQAPQAVEAFLMAVNLNHALPASWGLLEGLYRMTGEAQNAAMAGAHVATLKNIPRDVVAATAFFMDGDLDAAEGLVRAWLLQNGDHVEAMRLLARIGIARQVYDDPELLLAAVLERAPDYRAARQDYASVLIELHRHAEARQHVEELLKQEPDSRALQLLQAASLVGLGEHERAMEIYRSLFAGVPTDADLHLSIAHALKTLGRTPEAIASYRSAAQLRPDFGDAYWSLANLKTYRYGAQELERMRAALEAPATGEVDRYHLCFALAKALEDEAQYGESWRYYELGNRLKHTEIRYRPAITENNTRQQIEVCTAEFFASRQGFGAPDTGPIFIVGLPRSGSTLLEQILASHSQVEGTQELPNVQQLVSVLRGREREATESRYPRILGQLQAQDFAGLGAKYLRDTRAYRTGKPYFIDKNPNNFRHLGLVHLMLPNARIIDARREPMACCFSNLKQLFANGQEFTYGVEEIARYYRTYLELMRHWDRVLPGRILRVYHEDVVGDLEGNVRRMLDFCGLPFEPQCLAFHETQRSVRTASSEQVRQALYREGLEQWKHFEPWLGPLREALGDALTGYRET